MPIADSRVPNGVGILPLQHKDYDKGKWDLDLRASMLAVRVTDRLDSGENGLGQWKYDQDSVGDVVQFMCWPKASRPIPGWSPVWPARLSGAAGRRDTPTPGGGSSEGGDRPSVPTGDGGRPDVATGGGGTSGASDGNQGPAGALGAAGLPGGGGAGGGSNPRPRIGGANGRDGNGNIALGLGIGAQVHPLGGGNLNPFSVGGRSDPGSLSGIPGVGFGGGFARFSQGGSSSASGLSGIPGVGFSGGFARFSQGGNSSASGLSGIPGVGFSGGFASFRMPADPYRNPYGNSGTQLGNVFGNTGNQPAPPGSLFGAQQGPGGGSSPGQPGAGGAQGPAGPGGFPGAQGAIGGDVPQAGGKAQSKPGCGVFSSSAHSMLPCIGEGYDADSRYAPITPSFPKDENGRDLWKVPRGTLGLAVMATNEERQIEYFFPTDPRIYAVNMAGDPRMGTRVHDLTSDFEADPERYAFLQSAFRVVKRPGGASYNVLAFQLGPSGCTDTEGGYFIGPQIQGGGAIGQRADSSDTRVVAHGSRIKGGPFDVGTISDKHIIGYDEDGNPINMLHLGVNALFRRDDFEDGPLRFEHEYDVDHDDLDVKIPVHLGWTGFDWAWWTTAPLRFIDEPLKPTQPRKRYPYVNWPDMGRPGVPTVGRPGLRDVATVATVTTAQTQTPAGGTAPPTSVTNPSSTPSGGGRSTPHRDPGPHGDEPLDFDNQIVSTTSLMTTQGYLSTLRNVAFPGLLAVAQSGLAGAADMRTADSTASQQKKEDAKRPVSGQMTAFAAQGGAMASAGSGGSENVGAQGDPYVYTQQPGKGKFKGGTANGGWVMLPPEVDLGDHTNGFAPPNVTRSTTTFIAAPGTFFGAGTPELANGLLKSGFTWGVDSATGDLIFYSASTITTQDAAFKLTNTAQDVAWRSGTDFWATLSHAHTADRTHTFMDVSANVAALLTGAGAPSSTAPEGTLYWDTSGNLLYVNNNGASSWTLISGGVGGVSGTGAANQVAYWTAATTIAGDAGLTYDAATDKLTITGAVSHQLRIAYDGAEYMDIKLESGGGGLRFSGPTPRIAAFDSYAAEVGLFAINTNTGASAGAVIQAQTGGDSAADAYFVANVSGGTYWSWGLDNSDSNSWVLSQNNGLGTNNRVTVATSGATTIAQWLNVGTTTDAAAQGDFAAGFTGAASRIFYDQSAAVFYSYGAAGTIVNQLSAVALTATVLNEQGADLDFRVEGDTLTHLFFVDASVDFVGINTSGPDRRLDILDSTTPQLRLTRTDGSVYADYRCNDSGNMEVSLTGTQFALLQSTVGGSLLITCQNNDDTNAASNAYLRATAGGASGGDAAVIYTINGFTNWISGIDNSDSDKWKVSASSALGSNDYLTITTAGVVTLGVSAAWTIAAAGGLTSAGNYRFAHGTSALATTATEGFLHLQSCAGTPTGIPASIPSGQTPMCVDSTGTALYGYIAGSWVSLSHSAGTLTGSGVAGRVAFWSGASALGSDADFLYDTATDRFTVQGHQRIGTATDAAAQGDLSVGLTGAARMFYDQSVPTLDFYNSSNALSARISAVAGTETVFNEASADIDFRVEGDTTTHLIYGDASTGRVGIRCDAPSAPLHIKGSGAGLEIVRIANNDTAGPSVRFFTEYATTTDATVTTLWTHAPPNSVTFTVLVAINARRTDVAGTGAGYVRAATFRVSSGGVITQVGATTAVHTAEDSGSLDATVDTDASALRVRVTGIAAQTYAWDCSVQMTIHI